MFDGSGKLVSRVDAEVERPSGIVVMLGLNMVGTCRVYHGNTSSLIVAD